MTDKAGNPIHIHRRGTPNQHNTLTECDIFAPDQTSVLQSEAVSMILAKDGRLCNECSLALMTRMKKFLEKAEAAGIWPVEPPQPPRQAR